MICFFFQAEDGIRDLVRSRGLGDVYKRQVYGSAYDQPVQVHYSIAGIREYKVTYRRVAIRRLSLIHI